MSTQLTPIERKNNIWLKRDDLFEIAGVCGGKARTCWHLSQRATGLVSAGARQSPQILIVAHIARYLGIPCRIHTPFGKYSPEMNEAKELGAEIIQCKPGFNNILISRAKKDASILGWTEIPFGMECNEAIEQTRKQVENIPEDVERIVVTVGSGMSLAGLLWGLFDISGENSIFSYNQNSNKKKVVGVVVGANPIKRLNAYAPPMWEDYVELVQSDINYHSPAEKSFLNDIQLDPIYEAKCLPYLRENDLFWVVGIRTKKCL